MREGNTAAPPRDPPTSQGTVQNSSLSGPSSAWFVSVWVPTGVVGVGSNVG
jgi:hypothetical protein